MILIVARIFILIFSIKILNIKYSFINYWFYLKLNNFTTVKTESLKTSINNCSILNLTSIK